MGPKSETFNGPKRPFRALGHSKKVLYQVKVNMKCEFDPDKTYGSTLDQVYHFRATPGHLEKPKGVFWAKICPFGGSSSPVIGPE